MIFPKEHAYTLDSNGDPVKMKYDGNDVDLTVAQDEVATTTLRR